MNRTKTLCLVLALASMPALAQSGKPMSPSGTAATQVGGKWDTSGEEPRYSGGKWIEIEYSRPIVRSRPALFGAGATYGKTVTGDAPLWRLGANTTTRMKTEAALEIGGKRIEPGTYSLFAELKEGEWTLVVSKQPAMAKWDAADKKSTYGAYNYDKAHDVARVPMKVKKGEHSVDQLTIGFVDVTDKGGKIAVAWDKEIAMADFSLAK